MSLFWLEAALDPVAVVRADATSRNESLRQGLAYLLAGRFLAYDQRRASEDWPQVGAFEPGRPADAASRLLLGTGLYLVGDTASQDYLRRLATHGPKSDLRTVAAVLCGMALADANRPLEAARFLQGRARRTGEPLDRAVLWTHSGIRFAEAGEYEAALKATRAVRELGRSQTTERGPWLKTMKAVAGNNELLFSGPPSLHTKRRKTARVAMVESIDDYLSEGLAAFVDGQFEEKLRDPYTRTITWGAQDPAEQPLTAALLRAELVADWSLLRRVRRVLGRFELVTRLRGDRSPSGALHHLRRAGDEKGLAQGARAVFRMGPVSALRDVITALRPLELSRILKTGQLPLIREGADLLQPREADSLAHQFAHEPELLFELGPPGMQTVARVCRVASGRGQTATALGLRALADRAPDHALSMLAPSGAAINWQVVTKQARTAWVDYVQTHISTPGDQRFLAEAVSVGLATSDAGVIKPMLRKAFDEREDLDATLLLLQAEIPLDPPLRRRLIKIAVEAVQRVQRDAAEGRFGLGRVAPAHVLAVLLRRQRSSSAWRVLVDFLLDERVAGDDKGAALDLLADGGTRIPHESRGRLRSSVRELRSADVQLFRESPVGPAVRLALRLGAFPRADALSAVLRLADSPDLSERVQAGQTLVAAYSRLHPAALATLALSLSEDGNHEVRAVAGRSLAALPPFQDQSLRQLVTERLRELMREVGVVVPRGVLLGLARARHVGHPTNRSLLEDARSLGKAHPAYSVRSAAERATVRRRP